jgi:uncharacterized membrane protein (DUF106 family)
VSRFVAIEAHQILGLNLFGAARWRRAASVTLNALFGVPVTLGEFGVEVFVVAVLMALIMSLRLHVARLIDVVYICGALHAC